jgi:hypothetical protein
MNIARCLIVIKGHVKVINKSQDPWLDDYLDAAAGS